MRIAVEASTWVNPRGYGRFTRELTRALLRAAPRHEFTLVLDSGAAAAPDLPDAPRLVAATRRPVTSAAGAGGSRSPGDIWRMTAALSRRDFDAVLFPTIYSFVPVTSHADVTVVVHDAMPETVPHLVLGSWRARAFWTMKTRLACRRADRIATVSQASAEAIRRHLPVARSHITVLTEGVAEAFTASARPEDDARVARWVDTGERFVLYVGGLSPHKRVPELIKAFETLTAAPRHRDLRLVLAGPGDLDSFHDDARAVAEALQPMSLRQRVVRTGFVADEVLASLYRRAACVVLPSMVEGFGLPALEAMACGAPLIVARTPALVELCGDAAVYVEDIGSLAGAIDALLQDAGACARLRHAGPTRAAGFTWDEAARRWLAAVPGGTRG